MLSINEALSQCSNIKRLTLAARKATKIQNKKKKLAKENAVKAHLINMQLATFA